MPDPRPRRDPMFLIIAGAITAAGLPFAVAFPRTLPLKMAAIAALVAVASAIAWLARRGKKP